MRGFIFLYFYIFSSVAISQTSEISIQINNFTVLDSKGEVFAPEEESNILGNNKSRTEIFSPTITYFSNNKKKLLYRFGFSSRKAKSFGTSYNEDGSYQESKMLSKDKSYLLTIGIYDRFDFQEKIQLNLYASAFAGIRVFNRSSFEVTFFDSQNQMIGLNGLEFTSPLTYKFGLEVGSIFLYQLNPKIGIGFELGVPVYALIQKGRNTRINYSEDQNERFLEIETIDEGRTFIFAKSLIVSPSIRYSF